MLWHMKRCEVAEATMHSQANHARSVQHVPGVVRQRCKRAEPHRARGAVRLRGGIACVRGGKAAEVFQNGTEDCK